MKKITLHTDEALIINCRNYGHFNRYSHYTYYMLFMLFMYAGHLLLFRFFRSFMMSDASHMLIYFFLLIGFAALLHFVNESVFRTEIVVEKSGDIRFCVVYFIPLWAKTLGAGTCQIAIEMEHHAFWDGDEEIGGDCWFFIVRDDLLIEKACIGLSRQVADIEMIVPELLHYLSAHKLAHLPCATIGNLLMTDESIEVA